MVSLTLRPIVPNDLAEFRRQYGLSQRACGALFGVEQSIIRRWETGQMRIENPVLLALALEGARQVLAERCRTGVAAAAGATAVARRGGADTPNQARFARAPAPEPVPGGRTETRRGDAS